jgi:hypothetical protein
VRKFAAKTQPKNESKMNELRKDVTDYDISDQKKRKFLFTFGFKELRNSPQISFDIGRVEHVELFGIRNIFKRHEKAGDFLLNCM